MHRAHPLPDGAERGVSLILVCLLLAVLLGVAALTIDLASLYVARNEAQRAADAAALAGAQVFADSGCTNQSDCSAIQASARQRAIDIGNQNTLGSQAVSIAAGDVAFVPSSSKSSDPEISVTVHSSSLPTFFAKIFGVGSGAVGATATAEAYNPSNASSPPVCVTCMKPIVAPNCDPTNTSPANPNCSGTAGYFVDPTTGAVEHPGTQPAGVIGMEWTVHEQLAAGQYGTADLGGGSSNLGNNISTCNTNTYTCGNTLTLLPGKKVGIVTPSIEQLIHAASDGPDHGQDTIDVTVGPPFPMSTGSNNPLVNRGVIPSDTIINTSSSLVSIALYDGSSLGGGHPTVTIVGFMQVFIEYAQHSGSTDGITVRILNVTGCGTRPSGTCGAGSGTVSGGGTSLVVVRLVRNP